MVLVRFENGKWKQVSVEEKTGNELYLNAGLKKKLDFAKDQVRKDYDVGGLIVGDEGTGKSTFASNIMIYMTDGKFSPKEHIIKDHDEALEKLLSAPDEGGVMFDEGFLLFYSGDVVTKKQKQLTKIFSIIRQKKLFFLIVAPSFFRIATYFAVDRTRFMCRVYTSPKGERGYFKYWGHRNKKRLFTQHKKDHLYLSPSFSGRFTKCSLLDEEYKEIKRETLEKAFLEAREMQVKKLNPRAIQIEVEKAFIMRNQHLKNKEIAGLLGVSMSRFYELKQELGLTRSPLNLSKRVVSPLVA